MYVGQRVRRREDLKFITGKGTYVDDLEVPGMLYLKLVRSQVPHGSLRSVDLPQKNDGKVWMIKGVEIEMEGRPLGFPMASREFLYVGHPLAAVLAEDPYEASDLAESVEVDYKELPYVTDLERALEDRVRAVSDRSNIAYSRKYEAGKAEEVISSSERVLEEEIKISRVYPAAMEARGVLVIPQGNSLTVYASTQSPHYMRRYLMQAFGRRVQDIRVVQADTGGAFGSKLFPYPEEFIAVEAALRIGRPVKWVASRSEDMRSTYHGRGQVHRVKVGFTKEGIVRGLTDELIIDLGAAHHGTYLADIAATMLPGPYNIRDIRVEVKGVYTNKTPLDQYRGAGRPEATFVIERIMDMVSDEIGADPLEVRKRNIIKTTPFKNAFGLNFESGDYMALFNRAEKVYREMEAQSERARKERGVRAGVGFSFYVEENNFGPWESASVRVRGDGTVLVIIGAAPHGQGTGTSIAQVVADELGIPLEDVDVTWGDTATIGEANGTYGSRSLTLAGNAALLASRKVKEKAVRLAAQFMKADVQELEYTDGKVRNPKTGKEMTLRQIASKAMGSLGGPWKYREEPGLESTAYFGLEDLTHPYGSHVAFVEVDQTGKVKVLHYYALDDVGLVVNPMLAEGQVIGGVVQSFGEAVLEEVLYSEEGQILTSNLGEYALPTAVETFRVSWEYMDKGRIEAPLPSKGIGEGATIGGPPAIVRALERAVGKRITALPIHMEDLSGK